MCVFACVFAHAKGWKFRLGGLGRTLWEVAFELIPKEQEEGRMQRKRLLDRGRASTKVLEFILSPLENHWKTLCRGVT